MKNLFYCKKVHFIGIGGISMSGLAKWCFSSGATVTGSDIALSNMIIELNEIGINAYVGSCPEIAKNADIVVYSSAISDKDSELVSARNAGVECFERHRFLGLIAGNFNEVIAVSGTHGKTTTTGILGTIFKYGGKNFTAHIGGEVNDLGGNFYIGGDDYFITEACEYKRSFLSLSPDTVVILNIESDHPDCYATLAELTDTFQQLIRKVKDDGLVIINGDIEYYDLQICPNIHMLTFGFKNSCDCYPENIVEHNGKYEFDIILKQKLYSHVNLNLYGRHNILNTLAAVLTADFYGISKAAIVDAIENFNGVKRRFEDVTTVNGARVIVDYAHHPSEIKATIKTAQKITVGNLRVYFQPHTFSRTAKYFNEFANSFDGADELSLIATYPSRESPDKGKSAFELFYYINENIRPALYFDNLITAASHVVSTAMPGDVILILGAGDIVELAKLI